jgi:hypothetical protein
MAGSRPIGIMAALPSFGRPSRAACRFKGRWKRFSGQISCTDFSLFECQYFGADDTPRRFHPGDFLSPARNRVRAARGAAGRKGAKDS